jgi:hypothetical protein
LWIRRRSALKTSLDLRYFALVKRPLYTSEPSWISRLTASTIAMQQTVSETAFDPTLVFFSICSYIFSIYIHLLYVHIPMHRPSTIYKAIANRPAKAATTPTSSLPAAPVDSAIPPEDVPVALVGLGAAPVAVARVELPEGDTMMEPVPEAEADAPVPLGFTLPEVEVGTLVAVFVSLCTCCSIQPQLPNSRGKDVYVQTLTPWSLQMSAKALRAAFVSSPQNLAIFVLASLAWQTDFRSAGSEYSLTAPRRQPGGVATANCASAKKVAAKTDLASMLAV